MTHRRSKKARERREKKRQEHLKYLSDKEKASNILHRYSWRDSINGELVFTEEGKYIVEWKLKENFGDGYPVFPLNHEFGDVLNRFLLKAPPLHTYHYSRGRGQCKNELLRNNL